MLRAQLVWELAENLHRLDLTKDQRDHHIRRYAELLEVRRGVDTGPRDPERIARPFTLVMLQN
jgi:hypothetical protein